MQKPTPQSIEALVADVQYHQWPGSTMITCKITAQNGHEYTADSKPIDAADFTVERGQLEACKKAVVCPFPVGSYVSFGESGETMQVTNYKDLHLFATSTDSMGRRSDWCITPNDQRALVARSMEGTHAK